MTVNRNLLRVVCVVCGTVLFIVYSVTGANGALTGAAGTLIGVGIDILREHTGKEPEPE